MYVELPDVGAEFDKGDSFGSVESVKAASDLYLPVGGTILEVNEKLNDEPSLINSDAESGGWICKIEIKDPAEAETLMDSTAYEEFSQQ